MPNAYAKVELINSVADHVQALTMPVTIKTGLTLREAVLNPSDCFVE
jgi:hypothetical protein